MTRALLPALLAAFSLAPLVQGSPRMSSFQMDVTPDAPTPGQGASLVPPAPRPPLPLCLGDREPPVDHGSEILDEAAVSSGLRATAPAPRR